MAPSSKTGGASVDTADVVDRAVDIEAVDEDAGVILREAARDDGVDTKGLWFLMPSRSFIC